MEVHVLVSTAKGKSKVKQSARQSNVGDKLERLRREVESLPSSLLPSKDSEEVRVELERLPSPASLLPGQDLQEPKEPEEPKDTEGLKEDEEQEEPEDADEHKKSKEPACGLEGHKHGAVSKSKTVQAWHRDLLQNLKSVSTPPKVSKSKFRDARKLFGVNCNNKVTLRNSGHLGAYEEIVLLQFDPNFMSTKVFCRHPSCNNINPAAAKSGKRDLYLCPSHQQVLKDSISDALAKKSVEISTSSEPEPGHFVGYTSLISLLEGFYHDAKKFQILQGKALGVQEAILNVRNFLIITSTVLNPDEDNLSIALTPVFRIFRLILENPEAVQQLEVGLIYTLREVIEMILFAFGVIYRWVSLALLSPGAQIGAGVGGCVGSIGFVLGPWRGVAGLLIGGTLGGLIGNGIYNLSGEPRRQEIDRFKEYWRNAGGVGPYRQPAIQYPVYYFNGDALGGLDLHPFAAF